MLVHSERVISQQQQGQPQPPPPAQVHEVDLEKFDAGLV